MKKSPTNILLIITSAVWVGLKIICSVISPATEPHNDTLLLMLSVLYFLALGTLSFLCGKHNGASMALTGVLTLEILISMITVMTEADFLQALSLPILAPVYALFCLLRQLEYVVFDYVCQTFSDWTYFLTFAVVHLAMIGLIFLGRKLNKT